jgi:hypothetical protein
MNKSIYTIRLLLLLLACTAQQSFAQNQYNQRTDQLNNMYGDFQTTRPARQSDVNAGNASASDYSMAVKPLPLTRQQQHNQKVGDFYHSFPAKQSDVDAGDVDVSDYSLSRGITTPKLARVKEADDSYDPFANDPAADAKHEADVFAKMRQQQQQGKGTSLKNMNPLDRDQYLKNTNRQWDSTTQRSVPSTQQPQPQNEDAGPQQKAVGQLGATAKVNAGGTILGNPERSQKGLRGKLVGGTNEGVDLETGVETSPVKDRNNNIKSTNIPYTGAETFPVKGSGKIEVNPLSSPLEKGEVKPYSKVKHVDLTTQSADPVLERIRKLSGL